MAKIKGLPEQINKKIKTKTLSIKEYFEYGLTEQVAFSCLIVEDRNAFAQLPQSIIKDIVSNELSLQNMVKHHLAHKISVEHLKPHDKALVENYGLDLAIESITKGVSSVEIEKSLKQ